MKSTLQLICFCFLSSSIFAQTSFPEPSGGGAYHFQNNECITHEARQELRVLLQENLLQLEQDGIISSERSNTITPFIWPIQQAEGFNYNSVYGISNFVDLNTESGIQDFNCGNRSYNGHRGTDIYLWPFQWHMVENNQVEVIAAAPGIIFAKQTGNNSYNCEWQPGLTWNAVFIRHADNSTTWYGHMKEGSLTSKGVGDAVAQGEYLGIVASSGYSTGPHLHFEAYDADGDLIDPYSGTCNNLNNESYWVEQKPYREPTINAVLTHRNIPNFTPCDAGAEPEDNYVSDCFERGDDIYLATYYHDQEITLQSSFKVFRPDNSIEWQWSHNSPDTYGSSYWYWIRTIPANAPEGLWTFEVTFQGQTVSNQFYVGGANISSSDSDFTVCEGESLMLTASAGATYQWSDGSSNQNLEATTPGLYSVTVTTEQGCTLEATQMVTISPSPIIAGINGPNSSTPLTTENYAVINHPGSSYTWTVTGGTQTSGGNSSSIDVEWSEGTSAGQVCVFETNGEGCSGEMACLDIELIISSTSSIDELTSMNIFPNPASNQLQIALDFTESIEQVDLYLHNTMGQQMRKLVDENLPSGKWQTRLDVAGLSTGVYWLTIQVGNQLTSKKVIIL